MTRAMMGRRRATAIVAALAIALALLVWLDHQSVERGNRLFREGEFRGAEAAYRRAAGDSVTDAALAYNLGTARVARGAIGANIDAPLEIAANSGDSLVAQRANYNLAYSLLTRIDASLPTDSAVTLLESSVASGRQALRVDPRHADARWNLALAQRMLDSLTFQYRDSDREALAGRDEIRLEDRSLTRSSRGSGISGLEPDDAKAAQSVGERSGAAVGAREARASQDPGPVSASEARLMLQALDDDPEQLVRGILWAHRPDVAWWNAEPYPGGNW